MCHDIDWLYPWAGADGQQLATKQIKPNKTTTKNFSDFVYDDITILAWTSNMVSISCYQGWKVKPEVIRYTLLDWIMQCWDQCMVDFYGFTIWLK